MQPREFFFGSSAELTGGYRSGTFSPAEVAEAMLARAEQLEPALNAFQVLDARGARSAAEASAKRWRDGEAIGPLDGIPVTIKDLVAMRGLPLRKGSRTTDDSPCEEDSPSVARLREAGAVILGKTTTPEFGWKGMTDSPLAGVTRNPWNTAHTPGGSSGGAAAALAAGVGTLAHGNDGGGSIRIPSSYCGLFGLKPSFGRVPHHPQEGAFCTIVANGPIARNVADAALMLNEQAKPDDRDWYALPYDGTDYAASLSGGVAGMRIAVSADLSGAEPEAEVLGALRRATGLLEELGAVLEDVGPVVDSLEPAFAEYWIAGFGALIRDMSSAERDLLEPRFRELAEAGLEVDLATYDRAITERARLARRFAVLHREFDLLVTPTMPMLPPDADTPYHSERLDRWRHAVTFTLPFNLTGQPAASLPVEVSESGLPIGVQIVGPVYQEARVLRAAQALETAIGFPQPHPRLAANLEHIAG